MFYHRFILPIAKLCQFYVPVVLDTHPKQYADGGGHGVGKGDVRGLLLEFVDDGVDLLVSADEIFCLMNSCSDSALEMDDGFLEFSKRYFMRSQIDGNGNVFCTLKIAYGLFFDHLKIGNMLFVHATVDFQRDGIAVGRFVVLVEGDAFGTQHSAYKDGICYGSYVDDMKVNILRCFGFEFLDVMFGDFEKVDEAFFIEDITVVLEDKILFDDIANIFRGWLYGAGGFGL